MIRITEEIINQFTDYLFATEPFKSLVTASNRDGFKNIIIKLLEDLYTNIPEDVINYLESNASNKFLDLLYREAGISDYHISKVPENLKVRLSYLLNTLTVHRASQKTFALFHEALEEFFPKMNIYLININPRELSTSVKNVDLIYQLEPRYISDPENILTEVSANDLSGTFLMRPEQFIDREEKFNNIYPDYKSKQRTINVFPIKTGIIYVQNPSGIGNSHFDDYIPLMQTIGATLQKKDMISWKTSQNETRQHIQFIDFIKLCTYMKFKEFEFKQPRVAKKSSSKIIKIVNPDTGLDENVTVTTPTTYSWYSEPLEVYRFDSKRKEWDMALQQANDNGMDWSKYYKPIEQKLNDFILADDDDLQEAIRLEQVYKGLKRSGLYNSRKELNQFKTDWNTLRQKAQNTSIRKISNMKEFREELIGVEPVSILDFELILLSKFTSTICGDARDSIFGIKRLYETNKSNTLDPNTGLYTLAMRHAACTELNDFINSYYPMVAGIQNIQTDETQFLLDLFQWYIDQGKVPLLRNYYKIKMAKFTYLIDLPYSSPYLNTQTVYDKMYAELTNNTNKINFIELQDIIKVRYRKIVDSIDALLEDTNTTEETFVMKFLNLWKIISAEISTDKRIQYFWNEFFMRFIMGSSFKDFFYDPIMDMFLEYWFPAETSVQNKDIESIRIKDKMQTIPLESTWDLSWDKSIFDGYLARDQFKITVYDKEGNSKNVYDETFKSINDTGIQIISKS